MSVKIKLFSCSLGLFWMSCMKGEILGQFLVSGEDNGSTVCNLDWWDFQPQECGDAQDGKQNW